MLQTPRAWSGSELAERLEVSRRTVRRDVDRLRDLGYPVEGTVGVEGGYRLAAGTQAAAAARRRRGRRDRARSANCGDERVTGIDEASVRALAKLEQVMPPRLRSRFAGMASATGSLNWGEPGVDPGPHDDRAGHRVRRAAALPLSSRRRRGDAEGRRAERARRGRPPLVPRRVGRRSRRLADVPRRPDRGSVDDPLTRPAARAARWPRPGSVRRTPDPRPGADLPDDGDDRSPAAPSRAGWGTRHW